MTNGSRAGGVFVSYAREDRERVRTLVEYLTRQGFHVFWDEDLDPGSPFRMALDDALQHAACAVVVWTHTSVTSEFVRSEAARANGRGALIPVVFDAGVQLPLGLDELHHLDLSGWDGAETERTRRLVAAIEKLVRRGSSAMSHHGTLADGWVLDNSRRATEDLADLAVRMQTLNETLAADSKAANDLRGALDEVRKTYRAVISAIARFVAPAVQGGSIAPELYLEMERGSLVDDIETGRGHCSRIAVYYGRRGGLRDSIKTEIDPRLLRELDEAFARLATADGDLFEQLTEIGYVLTNESRVIANLLIEEQDVVARRRISEGRLALAPLEEQLMSALQDLRRVQTSVGYAPKADPAPGRGG